ncbi:hypothetical protein B0H13DRAFT_1892911 [Mycena leptocephala]|nr:hypothetical protein B0H13DRAFT_1892911 [Mycena leptocephala]
MSWSTHVHSGVEGQCNGAGREAREETVSVGSPPGPARHRSPDPTAHYPAARIEYSTSAMPVVMDCPSGRGGAGSRPRKVRPRSIAAGRRVRRVVFKDCSFCGVVAFGKPSKFGAALFGGFCDFERAARKFCTAHVWTGLGCSTLALTWTPLFSLRSDIGLLTVSLPVLVGACTRVYKREKLTSRQEHTPCPKSDKFRFFFLGEHAALLKSADPIVRAMRDPAGRAEIPAKCEKPKFGLVPAESLCSSFPTFEAPLPIYDTVGGRPCERSQKTEETALKSDALGTGSNLHIWPFLGAEAGSEQTHPTVTNQFYLE